MKRIWYAVIMIFIVAGICLFKTLTLSKRCDDMFGHLNEMQTQFSEKNYDEAMKTAKKLEEYWNDSEKILIHFIGSGTLQDVGITISKLPVLAKTENDEFLPESRSVEIMLRHIMNNEKYAIY